MVRLWGALSDVDLTTSILASWSCQQRSDLYLVGIHLVCLASDAACGAFHTAIAGPCRALGAVCLLENPLGSGLQQDMKGGNNFIQAGCSLCSEASRNHCSPDITF